MACEAPPPARVEAVDDPGTAGASAYREYERRRSARQDRVKGTLGEMLGGVVLAVTDEPQSTRAWERGSIGEQKLGEALAGLPNVKFLHDRRVAGTKGNIDHIVTAPAGVFVIDAKLYKGTIQIRDVGGFFKTDKRLYVGRRDCSRLAENMGWQVGVSSACPSTGRFQAPPTNYSRPVLYRWRLAVALPADEYKGVRLEGMRSIKKRLAGTPVLEPELISRIHHALAAAFPPK